MTYDTDDRSIADSIVAELFAFTLPKTTEAGDPVVYRYTSHEQDVSFGGFTWTAIPLLRSTFSGSTTVDPPALEVTLPTSITWVQALLHNPPGTVTAEVTRVQLQTGTSRIEWSGPVTSVLGEGRTNKLRIPSRLDEALSTSVPRVYLQRACNHRLFDERCNIAEGGFELDDDVTSITDDITIEVSGVGAFADQWFRYGTIECKKNGEKRLIVGQIGNLLTIAYRFSALAVNDDVRVLAGCDHTVATCKTKFNNVENFGGHPVITSDNPFTTSGPLGGNPAA